MNQYVITLEPERKIAKEILAIKHKIRQSIGDQLYIKDPAHITIYLGYFRDIPASVLGEISKVIKAKFSPVDVIIGELSTFGKDIVSKKESLFLTVEDAEGKIQKIQKIIIDLFMPYRIDKMSPRYKDSYMQLDNELKENIDKCGYPFIENNFIPHISFGLFDHSKSEEIIRKLIRRFPYGKHRLDRLVVYELDEKTEELKELKVLHI